MRLHTGPTTLFLILVFAAIGCSQSATPVTPELKSSVEPFMSAENSAHHLIGFFTFICDPEAASVEIVPLRDADFHLNALRFLEPPANFYLSIINPPELNGAILTVDIGIRHPFLAQDQYTGFDICGIVFTHGSVTGFNDPEIIIAGEGDTRLLNADGYTRWWNPAEFPYGNTIFNYKDGLLGTPKDDADYNCTINGYKYFADFLDKFDPPSGIPIQWRGMSRAGQQNIRRYIMDMSGGWEFNYAVDACWKKPLKDPPYVTLDDFPPDANRTEAFYISVTELDNSLYYETNTGYAGGEMSLLVDVWDHFDADLNKIYAECPDVLPDAEALSPIGGGEGYSTYQLDFSGESLDENGMHELFITVESETIDYGGILPGKPVCSYFRYPFKISPIHCWAVTWGGTYNENAWRVAVDDQGNSYVAGGFYNTVDFDPGPGIQEHTSNGSQDAFVSKFNSIGELQWALTWGAGGSGEMDSATDLAIDDFGSIYICGSFSRTVDFDPGPGITEYSCISNAKDVFLSKFTSNGEFQWARTWGGTSSDTGFGVAVDPYGDVYVTGRFYIACDFDPGPGVDEHTALGKQEIFLSKFNPNGEFQWAHTWGGGVPALGWEWGRDVCADNFGNIYVTGSFTGTCDFDPGPGVEEYSGSSTDAFLSKFTSNGDFHWARTWDAIPWAVKVDDIGDVYVTGYFGGTCDFDPGPGTCIKKAKGGMQSDAFLTKFNPAGDFQWAHAWGGYMSDRGCDIATDGSDFVYVTGFFYGKCDFDPGFGVDELGVQGNREDIYLSKFNPAGDYQWARIWGSYEWHESGHGVAVDAFDNIYLTGEFQETVDFHPGAGNDFHTSNGGYDAFLLKLTPDGTW